MEVETKILDRLLSWVQRSLPLREALLLEDSSFYPSTAPGSPVQIAESFKSMFNRVLLVNEAVRWGSCAHPKMKKQLDSMEEYMRHCLGRVDSDILPDEANSNTWIENGLKLLDDVKGWANATRRSLAA